MPRHDFGSGRASSPERTRHLMPLLSTAARLIANAFSAWLGAPVECAALGIAETSYERLLEPGEGRVHVVFSAGDLQPEGLMALPRAFLDGLIERLMGGAGREATTSQRRLTDFDRAMAMKVAGRILDGLDEALEGQACLDGGASRAEEDARHLPRTQAPTERYHALELELHVPGPARVRVALPAAALERARKEEAAAAAPPAPPSVDRCARIPLTVSAEFGHRDVTLQDMLALRPGSTIPLERQAVERVIVRVEGERRFVGRAARRGERVVVEISGAYEEEERNAEFLAGV
jgi:flagellar motor switch protein FliM